MMPPRAADVPIFVHCNIILEISIIIG